MIISIEQIRAARAMIGLGQKELAKKAGISIATLNNIERGVQRDPKISTVKAIQNALEAEGIEFLNEGRGRQGVCLIPKETFQKSIPLLIIDDNRHDRILFRRWLDQMPNRNFEIIEAANGKAGLDAFAGHKPELIILDFMMYGLDGFQLLATMRETDGPVPPIILVTGMHSDAVEKKAKAQGVSDYLDKNLLSPERFYGAVENALCG